MNSNQKVRPLNARTLGQIKPSVKKRLRYSMAAVPLLSIALIAGCAGNSSTTDGNRNAPIQNPARDKIGQQSKVPTDSPRLVAPPEEEVLPNKSVEPRTAKRNPHRWFGAKRADQAEKAISDFFGGREENGRLKHLSERSEGEMMRFLEQATFTEDDGAPEKRMFPGAANAIRRNPAYEGKRARVARAVLTTFSDRRYDGWEGLALIQHMPRTVTAYIAHSIVGIGMPEGGRQKRDMVHQDEWNNTAYWFHSNIYFLNRLVALVDVGPEHWAILDSDLENSILNWNKQGPNTLELWRSAGVNELVEPHELARYVRAKMNRSPAINSVLGGFPQSLERECRDSLRKSGR